ncbi:hypothetical protein F442_15613 [Phytophthora nicotianae P10297]|nr:hypothetical protein F443_15778 [Phytophthora nicotianae P1569]ETK78713.1 hypothetical protein L915_15325 [Phytophthora nicotianae]ETL32153.1 hypothetical protein L916_15218 [Phytophthora nicotianae]ETL85396.1 hypothetical protein L917_15047 [Phytophthora nicotianae]ETP36462.1 hypothetical protein F442_15613 [Phytophthora nicotianae P10297]
MDLVDKEGVAHELQPSLGMTNVWMMVSTTEIVDVVLAQPSTVLQYIKL